MQHIKIWKVETSKLKDRKAKIVDYQNNVKKVKADGMQRISTVESVMLILRIDVHR